MNDIILSLSSHEESGLKYDKDTLKDHKEGLSSHEESGLKYLVYLYYTSKICLSSHEESGLKCKHDLTKAYLRRLSSQIPVKSMF